VEIKEVDIFLRNYRMVLRGREVDNRSGQTGSQRGGRGIGVTVGREKTDMLKRGKKKWGDGGCITGLYDPNRIAQEAERRSQRTGGG